MSSVVLTSVWRLYTIVVNRAATTPYIDFTWWSPSSIILSCLEVGLAIICASIPIFWPMLEKSLAQIFVTHEVRITEHRRLSDQTEYELEQAGSNVKRSGSLKSRSGESERALTAEPSGTAGRGQGAWAHYKDKYVIEHVDPLSGGNELSSAGVQSNMDTRPKPKWRI